jgi:glucosamine--fructose-6-phosphate aminotransferase (isomerizing)
MIDPQVPVLTVVGEGVGGRAMQQVMPRLAEVGADVFCVGTAEAVKSATTESCCRRG